MRESNLRRPPFERPSTARRAHPTMLTGPNYAHARVGTMSMTLRSKSAENRRRQLLESSQLHLHCGALGISRNFLEHVGSGVGGVNQLKRAHSSLVPNATNIGLSAGAMATSGYSTMGGSSSGGHLASEGVEAEGESMEESGGGGREEGETVTQDLMGTKVPPAGNVHTDFHGDPSPVATVPPAALASTSSVTKSAEANLASSTMAPPPKPTRMTATIASRRQNSEVNYSAYGGTLIRQASVAERRLGGINGQDKAEGELMPRCKQLSSSAISSFGQQPQTSSPVLFKSTSDQMSTALNAATVAINTIVTTAQVRTSCGDETTINDVQFTLGSVNPLQPYTPHCEELPQTEEKIEETHLSSSIKLFGATCQCKTTATQTVPASDEEDEVDCEEMVDIAVAGVAEPPGASNSGRATSKKVYQHSTQSSSGRIDSIFDGGTDSSATAAQIVGIDQWSSSGTESTTGVIIRSGATAEWTEEQEPKSNPEPPSFPSTVENVTDCGKHTQKSGNTKTQSNVLPVDTLPARTSQLRTSTQPFGLPYGFSRSIPAGVHLAGLADPPDGNVFPKTPEVGFPANWVRDRQAFPGSTEPCNYPELSPFGFASRQPPHSSHVPPPHTCNMQRGFYGEGVAPCLYMHPLRIQDMKLCPRQQRERAVGSHQHQHHHHHHTGHHHRVHRKMREAETQGSVPPPLLLPPPDICCHGVPHRHYGTYNEVSPTHKRSHRRRDVAASRTPREAPSYGPVRRSKQRYKDANDHQREEVSARAHEINIGGGGEDEPPALPCRAHRSHRHLPHLSAAPPPTLPPKPGEVKEESYLCKLHSQSAAGAFTASANNIKRRQEEGKLSANDDRKLPMTDHHHHPHRHPQEEEQMEAPHRLKRRPVQSPALVGEDPQSLGISSPVLGEERVRAGVTRASPVLSAVTTLAGKKIPTSKEYMEKIGFHKPSIEALKRELRSVETASSVVTTSSNAITRSNVVPSQNSLSKTSAFSRGLMAEGGGQHPLPSISPSDEAAARLADTSGSASFGDLRSAIFARGGGGKDTSEQRKLSKSGKDSEGLLAAPQDATHLESESDSSPEHVGTNTVRRSRTEGTSRHSVIPPPGMSTPGETLKPPSLPRSSSFSSINSSISSSIVSYSRSQSLFSHIAALSNDSSVSQQSSSSITSSDEEQSHSSTSASPERSSHRRHPRHHRHACYDCVSRSQGHLKDYIGGSRRSLSRHRRRHQNYYHAEKLEGKRSKSIHSSRDTRPDSVLLKTLLNDEIALETIARQQKLLKRELAKQRQLAAELEEAKKRTQQLLEEKAKVEQKIVEKQEREEYQKSERTEASPTHISSHRTHHRSLSAGKRRHHHRKSHRRRRQMSDSEDELNTEDKCKQPSSVKQDEEPINREKRCHSKNRHRHHHRLNLNEKSDLDVKSSTVNANHESPKITKGENAHSEVNKLAAAPALDEEKRENFDQLGEGLPLPPPPPESTSPPQQDTVTITNSMLQIPDSETGNIEEKCHKSTDEDLHASSEPDLGIYSTTVSEEAGLARDIIKEVLKHTYARDDGNQPPSRPQISASTPSTTPLSHHPLTNDPSTSEHAKRTIPLESCFIGPMEPTPHHHELTGTCLEPVPEGRVAEAYSANRAFCHELTTFLGSSSNVLRDRNEVEEEEEEEEESDLDVEEIDSDTTSASEGSEDIEPFPLPAAQPPTIVTMKEGRKSLTVSRTECGRELHEVTEEMEGAAVAETSLMEHLAPFKPVAPVRLSQATVTKQPDFLEYSGVSDGGVATMGSEREEGEDASIEMPSISTATPSKRSKSRRLAARQRQKTMTETKPVSDDTAEI